MEGVCKCVYAQRHWFHRGSFHCRTRIRPATACVAACRCKTRNPRRIDHVGSHQRGDAALIPSKRHKIAHLQPPFIGAVYHKKTAEERFNMLARGWLAYPVTSIHSHLPPKSDCRNHIPRFALSRRRATALFRNPVCKAQRSVPGFSSTPTSACRRYATSPPSAVAYIIGLPHPARCITKKPPKSGCRKRPRRRHCEAQNAAERVPQRGSISAAHSGISEQYRFANIPSVVR